MTVNRGAVEPIHVHTPGLNPRPSHVFLAPPSSTFSGKPKQGCTISVLLYFLQDLSLSDLAAEVLKIVATEGTVVAVPVRLKTHSIHL